MSDGGGELAHVSIAGLLAPLVERWRLIVTSVFGTALLSAAVVLIWPRSYEVTVTLATVSSGQAFNLSGVGSLLASGLGALPNSGVQASPGLVSSLMQSRRVLTAVGFLAMPGGGRVADAIRGRTVPETQVPKAVASRLRVQIRPQTGLLEVRVSARDSVLARRIIAGIIDETSVAFSATMRAQASQLRRAQELRVDSASRRLERADEALLQFSGNNRSYLPSSRQALEQKALERTQSVAQDVYLKAVSDRESAVAKELEVAPALVVIDPIPSSIPFRSRYLVLVVILAGTAAFLFTIGFLVMAETLRRERVGHDADAERLSRALDALPVLGRMRGRASAAGQRPRIDAG